MASRRRCPQPSSALLALSAAAASLGCAREECEAWLCPGSGERAQSGDYRIELGAGSLISIELDGIESVRALRGGEAVIGGWDAECVPASEGDCPVTLKRLRVELGSFPVETNYGTYVIESLELSLAAPIEIETSQSNSYSVPSGTEVHTCLRVDGRPDHGVAPLVNASSLRFDPIGNAFEVSLGGWPVIMHLEGESCDVVRGRIGGSVYASGEELVPEP